jgi:mRNA interferase HigB
MRIFNRELLDNFIDKNADAESALQHWTDIVDEAKWKSHNELKMDFPSADYVGKERYVFNIRGNNYRLVVIVLFIERYVRIRFIGTHSEYNKINCKTI